MSLLDVTATADTHVECQQCRCCNQTEGFYPGFTAGPGLHRQPPPVESEQTVFQTTWEYLANWHYSKFKEWSLFLLKKKKKRICLHFPLLQPEFWHLLLVGQIMLCTLKRFCDVRRYDGGRRFFICDCNANVGVKIFQRVCWLCQTVGDKSAESSAAERRPTGATARKWP